MWFTGMRAHVYHTRPLQFFRVFAGLLIKDGVDLLEPGMHDQRMNFLDTRGFI